MGSAMAGGNQDIKIPIVVKISKRRPSPHFGFGKAGTDCRRCVIKALFPDIYKQMWRLFITYTRLDIAHRVIDMPIHHQQFQ